MNVKRLEIKVNISGCFININAHKDIYQAAQRLYSQGNPTDLLCVTGWLSDNGTSGAGDRRGLLHLNFVDTPALAIPDRSFISS
ncbi:MULTISPECIES: DnaB-like helicase N-terminal domain-containing protein [Nostoc]|uniref:DNA helicase DnaB-like N-terminal domain-containing protein n=1 Tax=Nostoc paludosum FACHB-159 TaxID=2692908 RepID=A0ABR8KH61_9NOSO|nr:MULTISPECIES: DnaB-like helicase N-terminal domain-containing protein [Nostoc]MBD2681783.1 hypothetical protein [Nostoc sp. FACHB-857]MBD2738198.1 hypothetical protein [Nostoc paludosum FACHB-159]